VTIEGAPHVHVDDAGARVDSYIVSVTGAGGTSESAAMVLIDSSASAATRLLLDSDGLWCRRMVRSGELESAASIGRIPSAEAGA